MKIGHITLINQMGDADRWSAEIEKAIALIFEEPSDFIRVRASDRDQVRAALIRLCDVEKCPLVLTIGGTGPRPEDIMPDATIEILERPLPGFGDIMRQYSYEKTPLAILSRAVAGIRGQSLIINLPGRPKAVAACLKMLREAISECIEQITGARPLLFVDPIVIPLEKWLPFLKKVRPQEEPRRR